jgi:hypothetical protein
MELTGIPISLGNVRASISFSSNITRYQRF